MSGDSNDEILRKILAGQLQPLRPSPVGIAMDAVAVAIARCGPLSHALFACSSQEAKVTVLGEMEHALIDAASKVQDARRAIEKDPIGAFKPAPPEVGGPGKSGGIER